MKKKFTFLMATLMLLTMFAIPMGMWGQSVVIFTPGTDTGETSVTKGDITATMTTMSNASYYQIYASQSGTFSTSNGKITRIEFTCTASGTSKYGPGNASADVGSYSYSGNTGTWTGESTSVTISSTAQVRMTLLTITYTPAAPSYTITAESNNTSYGTVSLSGSVITGSPKTGYQYASPAYTVSPANSATVTQNGNAFSVTPSANTTVTINFEAIPKYTASFSVNGTITSADGYETGETITFPDDPEDINGKTFVGWITETITGITQTAPAFVTSATMGNSDVTFYAVFANSETSQGTVEHELTITASTLTDLTGSYGDHTNTIKVEGDDYTIDYNACKQDDKIQMRDNATISYIHFPTLPGNIKRVCSSACYNGSGSTYTGTIHLKTSKTRGNVDTNDITKGTFNGVSSFSITMPANKTTFYFLTSAGLRLSDLTVVYEVEGDITVYSNYCTTVPSASTWTVTYNDNGADGGNVPVDNNEYNASNNTVTVLGNTGNLEKTGHTWNGWNTEADYTGDSYTENEQFTISESTTLYAQWMINSYSYTLNVIGDDAGALAELEVDGSTAGATIQYGKEVEVVVVTNTGYVYSISVKDANNNDIAVANDKFTMPASNVTVTVTTAEIPTYTMVTNTDQIVPGAHYIIASGKGNNTTMKVMGGPNTNNRKAVELTTTSAGKIKNSSSEVSRFVISGGTDNWSIYDEDNSGYLYTVIGNNYLKYKSSLGDDGKWCIDIDDDDNHATITVTFNSKEATVREMRYNETNTLFSCYTSGQNPVYLYKKDDDTDIHPYSPSTYDEDVTISDNITIDDKNAITVANGATVTFTGTVTCNTAANLIIEDGGQLVVSNEGVKATFKKNIAQTTEKVTDNNHWYAISSPMTITNINEVANLVSSSVPGFKYNLFRYNEADANWEAYNQNSSSPYYHEDFKTLENGRGYLYRNNIEDGVEFAGTVNVNNVSIDLTASRDDAWNGFNLIGNPFGEDITMDNISGKSFTGGYVLTNAGAWNSTLQTTIHPCQGFLVQVDADETITISKPAVAKGSAYNHEYLQFMVANDEYEDVTYALFDNGHGLNKINHRNAEIPMVYIPQNGQDYAIAMMNDNVKSFNLNFKAATMGQYTLSYKADGNFNYLHIIDRLTGNDIDMLLEGEYSFIATPNDNENRFIVRLDYIPDYSEDGNEIFAYQNGDDILVSGSGELQIFDVTGRMVMTTMINGAESINLSAKGVYVFRLVGETIKTQKIVVR